MTFAQTTGPPLGIDPTMQWLFALLAGVWVALQIYGKLWPAAAVREGDNEYVTRGSLEKHLNAMEEYMHRSTHRINDELHTISLKVALVEKGLENGLKERVKKIEERLEKMRD